MEVLAPAPAPGVSCLLRGHRGWPPAICSQRVFELRCARAESGGRGSLRERGGVPQSARAPAGLRVAAALCAAVSGLSALLLAEAAAVSTPRPGLVSCVGTLWDGFLDVGLWCVRMCRMCTPCRSSCSLFLTALSEHFVTCSRFTGQR